MAAVVVVVLLVSGGGSSGGYRVRAIIDNGAFMVPGEQVRVAGANVGKIESVSVSMPMNAFSASVVPPWKVADWSARAHIGTAKTKAKASTGMLFMPDRCYERHAAACRGKDGGLRSADVAQLVEQLFRKQ